MTGTSKCYLCIGLELRIPYQSIKNVLARANVLCFGRRGLARLGSGAASRMRLDISRVLQ